MSKRKPLLDVSEVLSGDSKRIKLEDLDVTLDLVKYSDLLRLNFGHVALVALAIAVAFKLFTLEDQSARIWVLLGLLSYIVGRFGNSITELATILLGQRRLQIHIGSERSPALFNAITEMLSESKAASSQGAAGNTKGFGGKGTDTVVSRDCECILQTDYATGQKKVKLGFWGRWPRREGIDFLDPSGKRHHVTIDYRRGADDASRELLTPTPQSLSLRMDCTLDKLAEKQHVLRWLCQNAYNRYVQPEKGTVDVYFPFSRSSDWAPEWKHERSVKIAVRSDPNVDITVGLKYHMQRSAFTEIINDATLWSRDKLRVYIVYGPPGVGKSHFVIRLAQALSLPIYRARLTSLSLGDDALQQLFSASTMLHEAALVHFDEFQGILDSWRSVDGNSSRARSCKVTEEGFNEFLQGGASMQKGVVVLTGSRELGNAVDEFPALFRRAACTTLVLPLGCSEISEYFTAFLKSFLQLPEDEWRAWAQKFTNTEMNGHAWSIDSLQQYLMKRVTKATERGLLASSTASLEDLSCTDSTDVVWKLQSENVDEFFKIVLDADACSQHLEHYAVKY